MAPADQLEGVSSPFLPQLTGDNERMSGSTGKAWRMGILAAAVILGFVAGIWVYFLIDDGYFVKWGRLPDPPSAPVQLDAKPFQFLQIIASDGLRYELTPEGWQNAEKPTPQLEGFPTSHACARSGAPFTPMADAPGNLAQCVELAYSEADGGVHQVFAVDQNGAVFEWQHSVSAYETFPRCLCLPSLGALVGFSIAYILQRRGWGKCA
jgi:hypothetical protein